MKGRLLCRIDLLYLYFLVPLCRFYWWGIWYSRWYVNAAYLWEAPIYRPARSFAAKRECLSTG